MHQEDFSLGHVSRLVFLKIHFGECLPILTFLLFQHVKYRSVYLFIGKWGLLSLGKCSQLKRTSQLSRLNLNHATVPSHSPLPTIFPERSGGNFQIKSYETNPEWLIMGNSPYPFCVEERVSLVIRGSQREERSPNHGRQQLGFLRKSSIRVTWSLESTDGKGTVSAQPQEQGSGYWLRGILSSNSIFLEYNYRLVMSLCCPLCCCFNPEMMMWDFCERAFLITFRLRCAHHDIVLASEKWCTFSLRRKHRKQKHIWM